MHTINQASKTRSRKLAAALALSMAALAASAGPAYICNGPLPSVEQLRETRCALAAQAQHLTRQQASIKGRADAAQRDLLPGEATKLDALLDRVDGIHAEIRNIDEEIADADRIPDWASGRGAAPARLTQPMPIHNSAYSPQSRAASGLATVGSPLFANMFPQASRAHNREFANLGEFARAVMTNDPRLHSLTDAASGMSEGVAADGGFYVPGSFVVGIMDASLQAEAIRPAAFVFPVESSPITIPVFDTTARNTGIAGLNPELRTEGQAGTAQKATLAKLTMTLHKQMVLVPATAELLEDSPAVFSTMLQRYMVESMSAKLDDLFLNGTGVGGPLGILNAPATISVAKETSQVAATIVPENLAKMVSRLAPGSFAKAKWYCHSSVLASLFIMAVVVKNVAGAENVGGFGPNWFTVSPDGTMSLLGRPLVVTDRCQQLGTVGDIVLADLSQYAIPIRGDMKLAVDNSIGFKEDETWFRLTFRCDGQPLLKSAITPRKGSSTLSPFVTLATRG